MTPPDYGRSLGLWRAACPQAWNAYTRHAFVEALGDGTLPRAEFMSYLRQDYIFLINFARAWSLAVTKSETLEEMQQTSAIVHSTLHREMALHVEVCAREGISHEELLATPEASGNIAYTRYVLDAGLQGDFLDLLAGLAPCVMGYGEIGLRLLPKAANNPYGEWIETYGGEDMQEVCRTVGALIDGAVARRLGDQPELLPRWKTLSHRFATASRMEAAFWELGKGGVIELS